MTGHGIGEAPVEAGRVVLEVRAINHRYLDVRVRLPVELQEHAGRLEERVRSALKRGRVDVLGRLEGEVIAPPELDVARAKAAFSQLCALRDELRPDEPVPLSLLASVPDLFRSPAQLGGAIPEALTIATDAACIEVCAMRKLEGAALAADLRANLKALLAQLDVVSGRCAHVVASYRGKLHQRLERLLDGTEVSLDDGRIEHEVAVFADRADVSEEVTRLGSHANQMSTLLDSSSASGKRLDFLLQEMSRETNTIGSKCSDAESSHAVVEMKTAISRMREQAQNVL